LLIVKVAMVTFSLFNYHKNPAKESFKMNRKKNKATLVDNKLIKHRRERRETRVV